MRDTLGFSPGVYTQPRYGQEVRISIRGSGLSRGFHMRGITLLQDGAPINLADDNGDFQELEPIFFDHLDQRMVDERLVFTKANLGSGQIPSALCAASGGVIGTACNIVREALRIALKRNARKISAQDISDAIDTWAIPQGFAPSNPLYRWREAA